MKKIINISILLFIFNFLGIIILFLIERTINFPNDIVSGISQTKKIGALLKPLFTFLDDNRNPGQVNIDAGINKVTTLRVENLSYSYPNSTTPAIENISFELKTGDKIAIVGLNGAGKSTLIKLICGLLKPSSGYIYFNDKDIISLNDEEFTRYVTILFQDYQLQEEFVQQLELKQNHTFLLAP